MMLNQVKLSISISMLTGENSILQKAADAKTGSEKANEIEQIKLAVMGSYSNKNQLKKEGIWEEELLVPAV